VGISPAFGEIPKGLVERGGSLLLAFHAFHSPVISTALRFLSGLLAQRVAGRDDTAKDGSSAGSILGDVRKPTVDRGHRLRRPFREHSGGNRVQM
jgi:hypothetical protein